WRGGGDGDPRPADVGAVLGPETARGRDEQVERVALERGVAPQPEVRLVQVARADVPAAPAHGLGVAAVAGARLEVAELVVAGLPGRLGHPGLQLLEARMRWIIVF